MQLLYLSQAQVPGLVIRDGTAKAVRNLLKNQGGRRDQNFCLLPVSEANCVNKNLRYPFLLIAFLICCFMRDKYDVT